MLGCGDDGLVGIVVGEVDISLLLNGGVVPAVVDAQGYESDVVTLDGAGLDCCILRFKIASKLRPIMSSIGFGEDSEVATLVLGELCVEGLQQCPDVRGSSDCARDGVRSIREASSNGLVNVKHVGVGVEAVWIEGRSGCAIDEVARTILLEKANH